MPLWMPAVAALPDHSGYVDSAAVDGECKREVMATIRSIAAILVLSGSLVSCSLGPESEGQVGAQQVDDVLTLTSEIAELREEVRTLSASVSELHDKLDSACWWIRNGDRQGGGYDPGAAGACGSAP